MISLVLRPQKYFDTAETAANATTLLFGLAFALLFTSILLVILVMSLRVFARSVDFPLVFWEKPTWPATAELKVKAASAMAGIRSRMSARKNGEPPPSPSRQPGRSAVMPVLPASHQTPDGTAAYGGYGGLTVNTGRHGDDAALDSDKDDNVGADAVVSTFKQPKVMTPMRDTEVAGDMRKLPVTFSPHATPMTDSVESSTYDSAASNRAQSLHNSFKRDGSGRTVSSTPIVNKLNSSAVAAGRTRSKLDMVAAPSGSSSRLGSGDSVEEAPQAATSAAAAPKPLIPASRGSELPPTPVSPNKISYFNDGENVQPVLVTGFQHAAAHDRSEVISASQFLKRLSIQSGAGGSPTASAGGRGRKRTSQSAASNASGAGRGQLRKSSTSISPRRAPQSSGWKPSTSLSKSLPEEKRVEARQGSGTDSFGASDSGSVRTEDATEEVRKPQFA